MNDVSSTKAYKAWDNGAYSEFDWMMVYNGAFPTAMSRYANFSVCKYFWTQWQVGGRWIYNILLLQCYLNCCGRTECYSACAQRYVSLLVAHVSEADVKLRKCFRCTLSKCSEAARLFAETLPNSVSLADTWQGIGFSGTKIFTWLPWQVTLPGCGSSKRGIRGEFLVQEPSTVTWWNV